MTHCTRWTTRQVRFTSSLPAILVVDDHEASGAALTATLGELEMDARFAASGVLALELIRKWMPDVVVLDINMPLHDGYSMARVLRRIASTRDAAILAFTSLDESEVREKGVPAGFDGYCQKGQSPGDLVGMIEAMVSQGKTC